MWGGIVLFGILDQRSHIFPYFHILVTISMVALFLFMIFQVSIYNDIRRNQRVLDIAR